MSTTPSPSTDEINLTITTAGELKTSIKNVNQHIIDGLKAGHSEIMGSVPAMKNYNDPTGHPEILNDPLYDKYVLVRRIFAAAYVAGIIGKNAGRQTQLYNNAKMMLEKLIIDFNNLKLAGVDTGIEGIETTLSTVKSTKKSYPANPDADRFRPITVQ